MSPVYQQQIPLTTLIQLSPIRTSAACSTSSMSNAAQQQETDAAQQALTAQHVQAKTHEKRASALDHAASGQAKMINALCEAQSVHAKAGFEAGVGLAQAAQQQGPQ